MQRHHHSRSSSANDAPERDDGPFARFRTAFAQQSRMGIPTTWSETYRLASEIYSTSLQGSRDDRGARVYADMWAKRFLEAFQATYLDVVLPLFSKGRELVAYLAAFAHDLETMPPAHRLDYLQILAPVRLQQQLGLPSFTLNPENPPARLAWDELGETLIQVVKAVIGSRAFDLRAPRPDSPARPRYDRLMSGWRPDVQQTVLPFQAQKGYAGLSQALLRAYGSLLHAVEGLAQTGKFDEAERLLLSWPGKDVLKYVILTYDARDRRFDWLHKTIVPRATNPFEVYSRLGGTPESFVASGQGPRSAEHIGRVSSARSEHSLRHSEPSCHPESLRALVRYGRV